MTKIKLANVKIRKALISDVPSIQKLINMHAETGEMLPRSLNELYENLRDIFVCVYEDKVVGCCALHIDWSDLAEVKSMAVHPDYQRKGIGRAVLKTCLDDARALGINRVFALTYKPDFFKKFGFRVIEKSELPHKIWSECIRCPKFPDCNEIAMIIYLNGEEKSPKEWSF